MKGAERTRLAESFSAAVTWDSPKAHTFTKRCHISEDHTHFYIPTYINMQQAIIPPLYLLTIPNQIHLDLQWQNDKGSATSLKNVVSPSLNLNGLKAAVRRLE